MRPETRALHFAILRLCKGILSAWELWLKRYSDTPAIAATTPDEAFRQMGAEKK